MKKFSKLKYRQLRLKQYRTLAYKDSGKRVVLNNTLILKNIDHT